MPDVQGRTCITPWTPLFDLGDLTPTTTEDTDKLSSFNGLSPNAHLSAQLWNRTNHQYVMTVKRQTGDFRGGGGPTKLLRLVAQRSGLLRTLSLDATAAITIYPKSGGATTIPWFTTDRWSSASEMAACAENAVRRRGCLFLKPQSPSPFPRKRVCREPSPGASEDDAFEMTKNAGCVPCAGAEGPAGTLC